MFDISVKNPTEGVVVEDGHVLHAGGEGEVLHDVGQEVGRRPDLDQVLLLVRAERPPAPEIPDLSLTGGYGGKAQIGGDDLHHLTGVTSPGEVQHEVGGSTGLYQRVKNAAD